ncbi:hypothetical protein [Sphingomonas solaris]|uniref:Uncharacterized protein n=1 Tax=Alterirhizorhabdus solaris TaxID=2529389 RepID=A0A558QW87_9SPHN|nr:hypothetical protein [Sphingomonas solaris]TVV71385.1 hypothetical protein FOY91_16970 [Sphingomonas solaris]
MIHRGLLLVAVAHLATIGLLLAGWLPVAAGVVLHTLLTLAAIQLVARSAVSIAAMAAAPLGPAAMLVAYAVALHSRRLRPTAPAVLAAHTGRGPANDRRLTDRIEDDRLRSPDAGKLVNFADALRHGDVALRQSVVSVVVRNFVPALSPLIAIALTDADQAIRTQAAAAVAEIDQDLARRRTDLVDQAAANPAVADALLTLLHDHAESNVLLSPASRRAIALDAAAYGAMMLEAIPPGRRDRLPAARRHAKALCRVDRAAEAVALLTPIVDPRVAAPVDITALMEALLAARAYAALGDLAQVAQRREAPPELAAMLDFWHDRKEA